MTRGCGILAVAAFATAATWPPSTPGRSSRSSALGFVAPPPPLSSSLPPASSARARLSWCGARSAASSERRPSAGGRGRDDSPRALRAAAFGSSSSAHSRLASGEGWGLGRARGEGVAAGFPCLCCTRCGKSRTRGATLPAAAASGRDPGDAGQGRELGLDPESVARAREAAKNDDYEWFMEFIGGDEEDGDESNSGGGSSSSGSRGSSEGTASTNTLNNDGGGEVEGGSRSSGRRRGAAASPNSASRRALDSRSNNGGRLGYARREGPDLIDANTGALDSRDTPRRRGQPPPRGFQAPPNGAGSGAGAGADGRRRRSRARTPADTAYDYDLDDEFAREPGRGGWDYDPGLAEGIGARRRDVEVSKVRAKTKPASMRMPLEEELEAVVEGAGGEGTEDQQADSASATGFEPVDSQKAAVLTGDLGYTQLEVSCMDPDMADLAIERRIRRPASGMPPDWVAVGMPPPVAAAAADEAPAPAASSQTYFGEGATTASGGRSAGRGRVADVEGGALDLDAILGDGYDYEQTGGGGGGRDVRQEARRRTRPRPRPNLDGYQGGSPPRRQQQERRSPYYPEDDEYGTDDARRGGLRGGRVSGGGYDDYDDYDEIPRGRGADLYYEDDLGGGGRRRRRRKTRPQRREPEMTAAERYEQEVFGGADGDGGGVGGGTPAWRREEGEEEGLDRDRIWTGVGQDGPWPTLEEFTKLLREETEVRLSLVGPWAAEVVAVENRFRLQAYEKWLEILDKGIGETLEEAGVFDASFTTDDDDEDDDDSYSDNHDRRGRRRRRPRDGGSDTDMLYDSYNSYGDAREGGRGTGGERGGGGGGYDPQGTRDERGLDSDDRLYGEDRGRRQRARRPRDWDDERRGGSGRRKFDVGSFLRDGAQSIMQPAAGMEAKAAEFERRYPGRTRSSARGDDGGEDDVLDRDRFSADDIGYRKQQPSQQQQQQQRGKPRTRRDGDVEYDGGGSRDAPPAGYYREEDEYDY